MADITVTAANVRGSGGSQRVTLAGFVGVPGKAVMVNAAGKVVLSDNNAAGLQRVDGITLASTAGVDQPLVWQQGGEIVFGGGLVAGATYWLSDTPGGICPDADVGAGERAILVGYAKSATTLVLGVKDTGVSR